MDMINEITMSIIKNAKDGQSIRSLAKSIGFAYSAVYKWTIMLEKYEVIHIIRKGNKNSIKIINSPIYQKCREVSKMIDTIEKDRIFWKIIKTRDLQVRCVQSTAVAIWTQGGYIPGDFAEKVYYVEVAEADVHQMKKILDRYSVAYTEKEIGKERPLIKIIPKKICKMERKNKIPVMPLQELVAWCKRLYLDSILEQLDELYDLKVKEKYAEVHTNR